MLRKHFNHAKLQEAAKPCTFPVRHSVLLSWMEKLKRVHGHTAVGLQQDALPGMG